MIERNEIEKLYSSKHKTEEKSQFLRQYSFNAKCVDQNPMLIRPIRFFVQYFILI